MMNPHKGYRLTKQRTAHGNDLFRLKIWKKSVYVDGLYAEVKIGPRQWLFYPYDKRRGRA